ncbi:MAG: SusC/RagA family TonB-linked outer membrane protein [Candidatus Cyclobacteriaceae bacterium M2_1C_046]
MKRILLLIVFFAFLPLFGFSQNIIKGKVTSFEGEDLPGVNILIEGTSIGTVTDINGEYVIKASPDDVLIYSFIGFVTESIPVNDQEIINVVLMQDIQSLQEVVVVGYGVQKKSVATGAISKVEGDALEKISLPNVGRSLQGLVSGVQVSGASGQPGTSPTILIRGIGTNGNNNPLVIIDGLQGGDLSTLAPGDIESIQVLKDAASTAIYGTKGANGVIYVTTKNGKSGITDISYDGAYFVQSAWRIPEMLNAEQYVDLIHEKYRNGGSNLPVGFPTTSDNLPIDTDWMGELFEPGSIQNHHLSLSKGTDRGTLYSSLSYTSQEGIIAPEKSNYKRFTLRINSESEVNEFIKFGENLTVVGSQRMSIPENNEFGTPIADALVYDPITPIYDPNAQFGFAQSPFVQKEYVNPFSRIFINNNESNSQNIYGNVYLDIKPLDWVTFRSDLGANYFNVVDDFYSPAYSLTPAFQQASSMVAHNNYSNFRWQWENYLTFEKELDNHAFNLILGTTAIKFDEKFFGASGQDLPPEALFNENLRFVEMTPDSSRRSYGSENPSVLNTSYFGRLLYNYKEKYLFTASLRSDGSSQFGGENRFGLFPAFSAGWVISDEEMWNVDAVEFLKLRGSYGSNGNDRIRSFSYESLIVFNSTYQFGYDGSQTVYQGAVPDALSNPFVRWEESKQLDIGIEARFFNSILSLEVDYYHKTTDGLLILNQATPVFAGNNPAFSNIGEIQNSGIEFKLDYNNNFGELDFGVSLNGSTLNNVVTQVDGQSGFVNGYTWPVRNAVITRMEKGEPLFYFRGYKTDGIFRSESEIFSYINSQGDLIQPNAQPGDLKYVDVNGDGEITIDDWTNIGSPWADFTFGINLFANYKSFDINILIAGQTGNEIYRTYERQDVINMNYTTEWLDRWSESNPSGSYPRVTTGANPNNSPSDFYVEDGSYARLRNVQIGYSLPSDLLDKAKIKKLRVYFSADNLVTLTGYSGFDPEIGAINYNVAASGIDRGFYPQTRNIGGGLQITF